MPSNKPRLVTYTDTVIMYKFGYISDYENRSMSKQLEYIVKEYIHNFEKEHGEIIKKETEQTGQQESSGNTNTAINIGLVNKNNQTFN